MLQHHAVRELAAIVLLGLLAVCVVAAGLAPALLLDGPAAVAAGIVCAAGCGRALSRPVGRGVGSLIESL